MDKIIVTALLIMASVASAVMVFNAIYPAIGQSSDAITSMERRLDERMKSQIDIIYASQSSGTVLAWVKNIGDVRIVASNSADVFFGPQGNFTRIPYGTGTPHWEYVIENDSAWNPRATLRISILGYSPLNPGRYYVKMVLPSGATNDYFFSW